MAPWLGWETDPDSDIDLLIEFDRSIGLFHFVHVHDLLKDIQAA